MKKTILAAAGAALLFASCAKNTTTENALNIAGEYTVVAINGEAVPATFNEVALTLTDSTFAGCTGLNRMGESTYTLEGNNLTFAEAPTTKMMADSVSAAVEDQFLAALHAVATVAEEEGNLALKDAEGNTVLLLAPKAAVAEEAEVVEEAEEATVAEEAAAAVAE